MRYLVITTLLLAVRCRTLFCAGSALVYGSGAAVTAGCAIPVCLRGYAATVALLRLVPLLLALVVAVTFMGSLPVAGSRCVLLRY